MNEAVNPFTDRAYMNVNFARHEIEHRYGPNVHILADAVSLAQLGDLCRPETTQPQINSLVAELYQFLIRVVVNNEFPRENLSIKTRMFKYTERGVWTGQVMQKKTRTVSVNIMRAGALPSQVSFDFFNRILHPEYVRQDHVVMARVTGEDDRVIGAQLLGSKIGGDIEDAIVIFPDPMGATGSSISKVIEYYKTGVQGKPRMMLAVHLIVTPEYIRRMQTDHPEVLIYALRLDRGASDPAILRTIPGERWDEESGLSDADYIVPGGGGFGELINNSYC